MTKNAMDIQENYKIRVCYNRAYLGAQLVKNLPAVWENWVWSLGWEDPQEKEMATHSSILAWRIPWTEELGGLQSTGRKESDMTERLHFHFHKLQRGKFKIHAMFLVKKMQIIKCISSCINVWINCNSNQNVKISQCPWQTYFDMIHTQRNFQK